MDRRLQLQTLLENLLGSPNVYFQPPATIQMQYPCIVYRRDDVEAEFAGNKPYRLTRRYEVTSIDQDPDSGTTEKIANLPMSRHTSFFTSDNLNHDVFTLFF